MARTRIVTDSTAYLPDEWRDRYGVEVVSLLVTEEGRGSEREMDMDWKAFYERLDSGSLLPKSSQPAPAEFLDAFTRAVEAGEQVCGVFLSSGMSGTYDGAVAARETVLASHPDAVIELVDSHALAILLAMIVRRAAEVAAEGGGAATAAETARQAALRSRWIVLPSGLENLRKGGRIGGAAALVGSALQILPVLIVENGKVELLKRVRTHRKALFEGVRAFKEESDRLGLDEVAVQHIQEPDEGAQLAQMIAACCDARPAVYSVGPVVGLHVGPGVGIAYLTREPIWEPWWDGEG